MTLIFDGTFEGLLTVVFECYAQKLHAQMVERGKNYDHGIFDVPKVITTNLSQAKRVHKGLRKKLTPGAMANLVKAFHSELPGVDKQIFNYMKLALDRPMNIEQDYRLAPVLDIKKVVQKVNREIHRMHAFVRFQHTQDNVYVATIHPDFDVIPFIGDHFKRRYADQRWIIYDTKRDCGLFYDLSTVEVVQLKHPGWVGHKKVNPHILDRDEDNFKSLWKEYFHATGIKERKNRKLHLQHLPRRYWYYLPEKN